jgi:NAD(P)-dependent dehydrogenase (short-subunit alcohol dehydrogenase family)
VDLLKDRAIVVTGAGGGLGAAYARLAAEEGALVVVNDVNRRGAEDTAKDLPQAVVNTADISTWEGAASLIDACLSSFGKIDGLVNNAGIIRVGPPQDATEHELRRVIEVNLLGTAFCGVLALRRMMEQGSGSIVNVTSGAQLGMPTVAGYAASKGGITSLTYSWAAATRGTGVRVNAVSPDAVTPLAQTVANHFPEVQAGVFSVESNAPAVAYLLSDLASSVNGKVILTGGERMTLLARAKPSNVFVQNREWTIESVGELFPSF